MEISRIVCAGGDNDSMDTDAIPQKVSSVLPAQSGHVQQVIDVLL